MIAFTMPGMTELLVIAAIAALIFGPRQLPRLGRSLGESIKEFRGVKREIEKATEGEWEEDRDRDRRA